MPVWLDLGFQAFALLCDCAFFAIAKGRLDKKHGPFFFVTLGLSVAVFMSGPFHLMRLASWVLFLHLPLLALAMGLALRKRNRVASLILLGLAACVTGVAIDAFLVEPRSLELNRHELETRGLATPMRIAIVADLQTDHISDYERRALKRVLAQEPDLILLPGDFIQLRGPASKRELRLLRELLIDLNFGAPLGAYAVRGNVDSTEWKLAFQGTRVTPLEGQEQVRLRDDLLLTGLDLDLSFRSDLRLKRPDTGAHVVFGHAPDFALGDVEADLLVAGHTHGGQVRLPFFGPLITLSAVPKSWAAGVSRRDEGYLVVSRGVGMEREDAPRLRFLCRPEVVILELSPLNKSHHPSRPNRLRRHAQPPTSKEIIQDQGERVLELFESLQLHPSSPSGPEGITSPGSDGSAPPIAIAPPWSFPPVPASLPPADVDAPDPGFPPELELPPE